MISADTKDALARDLPTEPHCRESLLGGLGLYGGVRGEFVTHRNAVARLFWSLLDERKSHPIEARAPTRLQHLPTFAIALPNRLAEMPSKPARKCDRLMEVRAAFLACGSLAAGAHGYHLEFVARSEESAQRLKWMLRSAGVPPKAMRRKGRLVRLLQGLRRDRRAADAHRRLRGGAAARGRARAARDEESHSPAREHRGGEPRAERAGRGRSAPPDRVSPQTPTACVRLTPALREVAELRLKYPDESLAELGRRCNPPIAKPTVGSRLGALSRLAEQLRGVQVSAKAAR